MDDQETGSAEPVEPSVELTEFAKAFDEAVDAKLTEEKKSLESHFNSVADKQNAEFQRKAEQERRGREAAEQRLTHFKTQASQLDPDVQESLRTADTNAELTYYRNMEQQRRQEDGQRELQEALNKGFKEVLAEAKVEENHADLDWATDAKSPHEATLRFNKSVARIQAQEKVSMTKTIADEVAAALKSHGIGQVDTSGPSGAGTTLEWYDRFSKGLEPDTPENWERAIKAQQERLSKT